MAAGGLTGCSTCGVDGLGEGTAATGDDGLAFGNETGSWVAHFTTAPTETTSAARRIADPPTAIRRPDRNRRGGDCFRCRPRVREGSVRYPELVTKVAPVMQLRALCCAIHSARHDPSDYAWPRCADVIRNLLIHWVIC